MTLNDAKAIVTLSPIETALVTGDLAKLNTSDRIEYYNATCRSLGLNPLTKPFDYISLNGKLTLYAKKDATDQLRKINNISIQVASRETINDVYVVTAHARTADGRTDSSTGAVPLVGLKGADLANAFMKAETKAKRRVTLSICGLGMLDELEIEEMTPGESKANKLNARKPFNEQPAIVSADFTAAAPLVIAGEQDQEQETIDGSICCGEKSMVSKWPNKETGSHDWYCLKCKKARPQ